MTCRICLEAASAKPAVCLPLSADSVFKPIIRTLRVPDIVLTVREAFLQLTGRMTAKASNASGVAPVYSLLWHQELTAYFHVRLQILYRPLWLSS